MDIVIVPVLQPHLSEAAATAGADELHIGQDRIAAGLTGFNRVAPLALGTKETLRKFFLRSFCHFSYLNLGHFGGTTRGKL